MTEKYDEVIRALENTDKILIGASNGLSIAEGIHIFADDAAFRKHFGDFRNKFGILSIIKGCFYPFPSQEEKWAFYSRMYDYFLTDRKVSEVMTNLLALVRDKDYFVVTSNIDGHFLQAGFQSERLFEIEGNCRGLQCVHGCQDEVYPGDELLHRMAVEQQDGRIPKELVPQCPHCGSPMQVHIQVDRNFLRNDGWQKKYQAYRQFIQNGHGQRMVLMELGVGINNQMIKAPFMELTYHEANATYIPFNKGELYIPGQIASKSIGMEGDIAETLSGLVKAKQSQYIN